MQAREQTHDKRAARAALPLLLFVAACATRQTPAEAQALTRTSPEPPGDNCAVGGSKIEIGQDKNRNGTLDQDEVSGGVFACNGPNGALVEASTLPIGDATCERGGLEVHTGTDTNGNGRLDAGEFERNYSCNGSSGGERP